MDEEPFSSGNLTRGGMRLQVSPLVTPLAILFGSVALLPPSF